jgi:ribosomal-protein-alanine N-acetyltransferase
MTLPKPSMVHPAGAVTQSPLRLYSKRVMLRPLIAQDFEAFSEVRIRNAQWLTKWEPLVPYNTADPAQNRETFANRCTVRDRDRQLGSSYTFGMFVNGSLAGEVNLNNVVRGALQCATIGYWIDEARAGNSYIAEAVMLISKFAFEQLKLHRVEICIIPRNTNSRRVMEKLQLRDEGLAERYLEINGVWEDHVRYGFTTEEWAERKDVLTAQWLER